MWRCTDAVLTGLLMVVLFPLIVLCTVILVMLYLVAWVLRR